MELCCFMLVRKSHNKTGEDLAQILLLVFFHILDLMPSLIDYTSLGGVFSICPPEVSADTTKYLY